MRKGSLKVVSFQALLSRTLQILLRIHTLYVLGNVLVPEQFGVFSLLTTIAFTISLFLVSGQYQAVSILLVKGYSVRDILRISIFLLFSICFLIGIILDPFWYVFLDLIHLNDVSFSFNDVFILLCCFSFNGLVYKFHEGLGEIEVYSKISAFSLNLPWLFILCDYFFLQSSYQSLVNCYIWGNVASICVIVPVFVSVLVRNIQKYSDRPISLRAFIKESLVLYSSNFGFWLYTKSDIFVIQYFLGVGALGAFSLVAKIAESVQVLATSLGSVYSPKISSNYHLKKPTDKTFAQVNDLILLMYLPMSIVLYLGSEYLINAFFSEAYMEAAIYLKVYVLFILFRGFSGTYSLLLDGLGYASYRSRLLLGFATANIVFNIFAVQKFGVFGVCLVTVCTYVPLVSLYVWKSHQVLNASMFQTVKRNIWYIIVLILFLILTSVLRHDSMAIEWLILLISFCGILFIIQARKLLIRSTNV